MISKRVEKILNSSVFENVNENFILNNVLTVGNIVIVEKNINVSNDENFDNALVVILKGGVSIFRLSKNRRMLMNNLEISDSFGMSSMFGNKNQFPIEIITTKKSEFLIIKQEDFEKIIADNPVVSLNYIKLLSTKIKYLNKKLDIYTTTNSKSAVAVYLMNSVENDGKTVIVKGSYDKLSSTLNMGRSTVLRVLDYFEKICAIERNGNVITVLDMNKLFIKE